MQSNQVPLQFDRHAADPLRACVHDLRNLFAVVASARTLLERPLDERKKQIVIEGLARVAVEGKIVTDTLLSGDAEDRGCGSDAPAELRSLAAVIWSLERPGLSIELFAAEDSSWILMAPAEFRAVILELVTNAAAAGARRIRIRAARRGCRYWVVVADDGSGFVPKESTIAQPAGLHGTGMRRLGAAVRSAYGKVRIRSQIGRGSVIALILPIIRVISSDASDRVPIVRSGATEQVGGIDGQRSAC